MNAPVTARHESITCLVLPLAAVFVVSLGYGVVLPVCSDSAQLPRCASRTP